MEHSLATSMQTARLPELEHWRDGAVTSTALSALTSTENPAHGRSFKGARILIVDDDDGVRRFLKRLCEQNGFVAVAAGNGVEALDKIKQERPDMVITDVLMPKMDGIELCRQLRSRRETALLPILIVSSLATTQQKVEGLDSGADEYISKPFQPKEILARIRAMLRIKALQDQLESAELVIFSLARAVEAKDPYTAGHIERVSALASTIGKQMGLDEKTRWQLFRGGILHDIGKIGVPDSILKKAGRLTSEEYESIKRHTEIGDRICVSLKTLQPVRDLIRHHHEKLDGSGYPDGLVGAEITLPARIMAVCDVYDALTSTRAYRKAMDRSAAMRILHEGTRAGHWDPKAVSILNDVVEGNGESRP